MQIWEVLERGVMLMDPKQADLKSCDPNDLVDLCDIQIDASLPLRERMARYRQQIRDPYHFKVDGLIIRAVYPPDAKYRLSDAIANLLGG